MTQKFLGHPILYFLTPNWLVRDPYQGGSGKTICAGFTPAAAKPALLRVLRNSPLAMPLSGYEPVRPELTCKESVLQRFD